MVADDPRIYFRVFFAFQNDPKVPNLSPKSSMFTFSDSILENVTFYFSSLTHFWSHESPNPRRTKCSYGPYGPF